jgi:hypothetical protein
MVIKQWTKLLVCVLVLIAATILILFDKIDSAAGVGLIMGVMGYVFGNGHAIAENKKIEVTHTNVGG